MKLLPLIISFRLTDELFDLEQTDARLAYSDTRALKLYQRDTHTHIKVHYMCLLTALVQVPCFVMQRGSKA